MQAGARVHVASVEAGAVRSRLHGAGLGLRRGLMPALIDHDDALDASVDFMEVAPENWIGVGGKFGRQFRALTERFPFVCHGLSLSLGGPAPLDQDLLRAIKDFLAVHDIVCYTEHLSACSDDGHLHDLMPIPFTDEAVRYVADRIRVVQDVLERRIGVENASCYALPGPEISELAFIKAVVEEADCGLLLDVNNVYVNSVNFSYDPMEFLAGLPGDRTLYAHIAGHVTEAGTHDGPGTMDLRVDTHGAPVVDDVWQLLDQTYRYFGPIPTVLERDFNLPPIPEMLDEVARIRIAQTLATASTT